MMPWRGGEGGGQIKVLMYFLEAQEGRGWWGEVSGSLVICRACLFVVIV